MVHTYKNSNSINVRFLSHFSLFFKKKKGGREEVCFATVVTVWNVNNDGDRHECRLCCCSPLLSFFLPISSFPLFSYSSASARTMCELPPEVWECVLEQGTHFLLSLPSLLPLLPPSSQAKSMQVLLYLCLLCVRCVCERGNCCCCHRFQLISFPFSLPSSSFSLYGRLFDHTLSIDL